MEKYTIKEEITNVENRLQFIVTLSVFFPTLVYSLFKYASEDEHKGQEMVLSWSLVIALYLINYCFFQGYKKIASRVGNKVINILLLLNIAAFVFPIYDLAVYKNGPFSKYVVFPFTLSLYLLPVFAILVLISFIILYIKYKLKRKE